MNEKEAIEILRNLRKSIDIPIGKYDKVIQWLQFRADIKEAAENPPEQWENSDLPYVYRLGKEMQREAHMELDFAIVCGLGTFNSALRYGELAQTYLKESRDRRYG